MTLLEKIISNQEYAAFLYDRSRDTNNTDHQREEDQYNAAVISRIARGAYAEQE